jgi:hypothetical protein
LKRSNLSVPPSNYGPFLPGIKVKSGKKVSIVETLLWEFGASGSRHQGGLRMFARRMPYLVISGLRKRNFITVHGVNVSFYVIARPFSKAEAISIVVFLDCFVVNSSQ